MLAGALCVATSTTGRAQARDSAACTRVLAAPASDSVTAEVLLTIRSLDPARPLPDSYAEMIALGVRSNLHFPRGLALDTYQGGNGAMRLTNLVLEGVYHATLRADGHLSNVRVAGDFIGEAFDRAMVASLRALDSSGDLPGLPAGVADSVRGIPIVLSVNTIDDTKSFVVTGAGITSSPLFRFRTPRRTVTKGILALIQPRLEYPPGLRAQGIPGQAIIRFVIDPEGVVDGRTVQAIRYTDIEFLKAVAAAVPRMRFSPLAVEGCAVRAVVTQPFNFSLAP